MRRKCTRLRSNRIRTSVDAEAAEMAYKEQKKKLRNMINKEKKIK